MSNPKYTAEPPLLCKTFPRLTSSPGDCCYLYLMRTEWRVSLGFLFIVVHLNDSDYWSRPKMEPAWRKDL